MLTLLPLEIFLQILLEMEITDIVNLSRTDRKTRLLSGSNLFWGPLVNRDFHQTASFKPDLISHFQQYQELRVMTVEKAIRFCRRDGLTHLKDKIGDPQILFAVEQGALEPLQWIFPDQRLPRWLAILSNPRLRLDPDLYIYWHVGTKAAEIGSFRIVQWLDRRGILDPQQVINYACLSGHMETVLYLINRGAFPDVHGANWIAKEGHFELLLYFQERGLIPDQGGIDWAAMNGHMKIIRHLNGGPSQGGINWAAMNGQIKILQGFQILPNTEGANLALRNGRKDILEWLEERRILPNRSGADQAICIRSIEMLKWVLQREIYPHLESLDLTDSNLVDFLMTSGIDLKRLEPRE